MLPSIGQTEKDITSEFACAACGIDLAVTQEISDGQNVKRFVVMYPNICANCGRPVNRRHATRHVTRGHATRGQSLPPLDSREVW